MGDAGEYWKDTKSFLKEQSKSKRARNLKHSTELLKKYNVTFTSCNYGLHLIVTKEANTIDFWPSTGKYKVRKGQGGRGIFNLLKLCGITV